MGIYNKILHWSYYYCVTTYYSAAGENTKYCAGCCHQRTLDVLLETKPSYNRGGGGGGQEREREREQEEKVPTQLGSFKVRIIMGNAVISGILFQPPLPPNPLWFHNNMSSTTTTTTTATGADTTNSRLTKRERESREAMKRTIIKNERYNISISYLWLYSSVNDHVSESQVGGGSEKDERWNLIPAIHITHNSSSSGSNSSGCGGEDDNASIRLNRSNTNASNASTTTSNKQQGHHHLRHRHHHQSIHSYTHMGMLKI